MSRKQLFKTAYDSFSLFGFALPRFVFGAFVFVFAVFVFAAFVFAVFAFAFTFAAFTFASAFRTFFARFRRTFSAFLTVFFKPAGSVADATITSTTGPETRPTNCSLSAGDIPFQ